AEAETGALFDALNARLAAWAIEAAIGCELPVAQDAVADFPGLPHRLQLVVEHNGVRFFNDSKSTTPEAAMRAIDSFEPGTVHMILGGYDKGVDLAPLAAHAAERCRAVFTVGATGPTIADAAGKVASGAEVVRCDDLEHAVAEAVRRVQPGEAVLLSPGCASWGMFDHFEQRGEAFTEAAIRWTTETGA
ncbi:MAG: glutamate ligase domain-containing protein, partial [Phycisphaeraceae bacterium]